MKFWKGLVIQQKKLIVNLYDKKYLKAEKNLITKKSSQKNALNIFV